MDLQSEAVTDEKNFDEDKAYTVAVPKEKDALKQHLAFSYPQWKLVDYDSFDDAADMIKNEKADCFLMGASQAMIYDNRQNFKSVPLTKTMEACFAVRGGEATLLSILNKTLKTMPSDMLTSALAIYDSTADKVTFSDFVKDNLIAFFITAKSQVVRVLLRIALLPLIAGISYELIRLAGNSDHPVINVLSKPGLWVQNLTTKEPDDSMIEVAICAVEKVFDWREWQEKNNEL